jgi:uncharacterized protein with PIN domain
MPRFVADAMVGKLARWLRAFGFDVFYHPFAADEELITVAREREAILLTRDTQLQEAPGVRVIFIQDDHVGEQLPQVVREAPLDLGEARPLTRCTACSGALRPAARGEVWERIPPFIYLTQEQYAVCPDCGRVYWEGTHVARLREKLAELARQAREAA